MKNRKAIKKILTLVLLILITPGLFGSEGGGGAAKPEEKKAETKAETTPKEIKKEPSEFAKIVPLDPPKGMPLSRDIHEKVDKMSRAQAPEIYKGKMILSYKPRESAHRQSPRAVAAVFEHESFTKSHLYKINSHGVFFLAEDLPSGVGQVRYRIVVDGLWMNDPQNPLTAMTSGQRVSILDLGGQSSSHGYPIIGEGGRVEFFLDAASLKRKEGVFGTVPLKSGQRIYLTGSFSRWDPYLYEMKASISHGVEGYALSLVLPPGQHYYRFVIGTKEVPDPGNPHKIVYDENNRAMSVFTNERNYRSTLAPVNWGVDKDEEKPAATGSGASGKGSSAH